MQRSGGTSGSKSPRRNSRKSTESSSSLSRRRESSPFEWRLERPPCVARNNPMPKDGVDPCRKADKENELYNYSSTPSRADRPRNDYPKRSHGISPGQFHKKSPHGGGGSVATNSNCKSDVPAWKEQTEHNLLIREHDLHSRQLEARRREFRKVTQLKTWPLQDMALEHLDYLLVSRERSTISGSTMSQFHGGDYLSSESSSSSSSVEATRQRRLESKTSSATKAWDDNCLDERHQTTESTSDLNSESVTHVPTSEGIETAPLWSLEPRIFATEKAHGKRKYLVGQFGRIADWYWRKATPPRHLYEVIRAETPCRLYFDLEYSKHHNPDLCPAALLAEFQLELAADLDAFFGLSLDSTQIINLDSSTEAKFSRHWIVRLNEDCTAEGNAVPSDPHDGHTTNEHAILQLEQKDHEVLFRDAPTVGRFVKRLVGRLADEIAVAGGEFATKRPALAKYLFVNTKEPNKKTCFIDLGVYTRNRLFRCLGSSKYGKTATLEVMQTEGYDGDQTYYPLELPQPRNEALSYLHESANSLTPLLSLEEFVAANNWEPHAKALADTLVVPLRMSSPTPSTTELTNKPPRTLDVPLGGRFAAMTYANCALAASAGGTGGSDDADVIDNQPKQQEQHHRQRVFPVCVPISRKGSPLPSLDKFISQVLASRGGTQGSIRAWSVEYGPREVPVSITYQMQRNRFCELVGRSHKSNNVFWTVDFGSWTCIQGCHDPDCHGRGSPVPISKHHLDVSDNSPSGKRSFLENIQQEFESWQEEEFDKALMALNLDDVVAKASSKASKNSASERDGDHTCEKGEKKQYVKDDETPCDLSDEALLQAMMASPDLFP